MSAGERGGPRVLGERRVVADAEREPPAADLDTAALAAGPEELALVAVEVLLVVPGDDFPPSSTTSAEIVRPPPSMNEPLTTTAIEPARQASRTGSSRGSPTLMSHRSGSSRTSVRW